MIFNTYWFVIFIIIFFPIYWVLNRSYLRIIWLILSCLVFHTHFAGPAGVIPIVILGILTYFSALSKNRVFYIFTIVLCVASLVFYKYTIFFSRDLLGFFAPNLAIITTEYAKNILPYAPPLALSFLAFEFVHYLVEIHRGGEPIRKPYEFTLFALYFPSLVAGPVKRYRNFSYQLHRGLAKVNREDVMYGIQRISIGAFKKIVIADNITVMIKFWEVRFESLSCIEAWIFLIGLAIRIYFDFSGYTDMAIGLSRMMGIRLPENFNYPYFATSISEFWHRWHISLSSWIRDYVYIPLGGNRHGISRKLFNGLFAFALCGFWHGAAWNFILWGLWHGIGLTIQSSYKNILGPFFGHAISKIFEKVPLLSWAITILFVFFGWLLFFYEPKIAWRMTQKLFSFL